jgi:pimeloyl-ACP methyl ester carboxylesterase
MSHDAMVRDLEAVVRASEVHRFTLWASTLSGPRAIAYAARHRRLVRRLILQRTFAWAGDVMTAEQLHNFADLARLNWPTAAQVFADLPVRQIGPVSDAGVSAARMYEQSTSGDLVARFLNQGFDTTARCCRLSACRR